MLAFCPYSMGRKPYWAHSLTKFSTSESNRLDFEMFSFGIEKFLKSPSESKFWHEFLLDCQEGARLEQHTGMQIWGVVLVLAKPKLWRDSAARGSKKLCRGTQSLTKTCLESTAIWLNLRVIRCFKAEFCNQQTLIYIQNESAGQQTDSVAPATRATIFPGVLIGPRHIFEIWILIPASFN